MFEVGDIICVRDFLKGRKPNGDKLFVVLGKTDDRNLNVISTSQIYFDETLIKDGKITDGVSSFYCMPKGKIVGMHGFQFKKDTIFSMQSNIITFNNEKYEQYKIDVMDRLFPQRTRDLLRFFLEQPQNKYKNILQEALNELNNI